MELTILGSGTTIPVPDRFPAGVLVREGDLTVLVDLGPGVLRRAIQAGVGPEDVDAVLFTHFHTDHTADLAALLFALHAPEYDGRPPLRLVGARGLRKLLRHLTAAWRWLAPRGYELLVDEIRPGTGFPLGPLDVTAVPIEHTEQSLAYRLRAPDGAVAAVSGDAGPCDGLSEVARDADLFVCESSYPEAHRRPGHLTPRLAGEAAARAGVRKLCLTHFYPECEGHDLVAEARAAYGGDIVLAEDLMRFDVTPPA